MNSQLQKYKLYLAIGILLAECIYLFFFNSVLTEGTFDRGILASGDFAIGIFAAGHFAVGIFAAGVFSVGIFSIGIFAIGGIAVGLFFISLSHWRKYRRARSPLDALFQDKARDSSKSSRD